MIYTEIVEPELKLEQTSLNIDPELWREIRNMAIDKGITATASFEQALREKLAKNKAELKGSKN